ncbi:Protein of unknown function [Acinetobacter marinus]|uniref:DUF2846 domain-containing protein n=1 Tax=Acinetobacter marinus TaxID=281375 RepID=A0A1G6HUC9_9GAMM|nr:DUF2846 domain-containing protein [Acinetobacter marinus]SDB97842.1 Protein of unknown function [Acinetobacter marinus]
MRNLWIFITASTMVGCASTGHEQSSLWHKLWHKEQAIAQAQPINHSTLPDVDLSKEPGLLEQYRVGKFSLGAWVNQEPGQYFQPVNIRHPQAAMVYMYRPHSEWNRQEILAPNFFINGERIPSLIDNHYYWVELPAGSYRLSTSHPLANMHFQKPKLLDFDVEAGQTYYIKYEEQGFRTGGSYQKPLYLMSEQLGAREIMQTQLKTPGISFAKYDELQQATLVGNIHQGDYHRVDKDDLSEKERLTIKKPFKLWNPLSW